MTDPFNWPGGNLPPADRERFARYAEALSFYMGEQWTSRRRRGEPRLTVNYARALLRKVASYVFPAPARFSVQPHASSPTLPADDATANRAERALAEVIAAGELPQLDLALCVDASVLGDAALKVTWDLAAVRPAVVAVDPATLIAVCAPDNPRRLTAIRQAYRLCGEAAARLFGPLPALAPERDYPVIELWTVETWRVEIAGQPVRAEPNPYGWIPYVDASNNPRPHTFWGESDLTDLYDVCRELNARLSVLARVLELSGAPIAVLENVDGSEGITVGPGAKWELPEGAKAYLLDLLSGGGVGLHVQYVDLLYRALHDLSETPRTAFGDSGRELSGTALEVEIQPLVQRVQRKRRMFDALYAARNARILDLLERFGGLDLGGLRRTETIWPSILPGDRESDVRNAVSLVQTGIQSRRSAIAALGGVDPDAELARVQAELALFRADSTTPEAIP